MVPPPIVEGIRICSGHCRAAACPATSTRFGRPTPGVPAPPSRDLGSRGLREAEADAMSVLREEDAAGPAVVFLLVDDSRPDAPGVQLAPEGVDVADGEPAARLLGVPPVDRQADLHLVPIGLPVAGGHKTSLSRAVGTGARPEREVFVAVRRRIAFVLP